MHFLIIVEVVDLNTFVVFLQFYTVSYFIFSYNVHHRVVCVFLCDKKMLMVSLCLHSNLDDL